MLKSGIGVVITAFTISIICAVGYISNIVKLVNCDFKPPYKCEVVRLAGLVPPVGAIVGWISNEKLGEPKSK